MSQYFPVWSLDESISVIKLDTAHRIQMAYERLWILRYIDMAQ